MLGNMPEKEKNQYELLIHKIVFYFRQQHELTGLVGL
jgi:hypothetical protein